MYFAGFGCISALGCNMAMTMSSIRAGISAYGESTYSCADSKPAIMATVPNEIFYTFSLDTDYMGSYSERTDRTAKLMLYALNDLQGQIKLTQPVPLLWLQEEPHATRNPMTMEFVKCVLKEIEAPVDLKRIQPVAMGRAGGIGALERAHQLLHQGGFDYVMIGGVECPYQSLWLEWLDSRDRLKKESSYDAFAPGEAAAFLLLSRTAELGSADPVAISLPAVGQSPAHWYNATLNSAETLHQTWMKAMEKYINAATDVRFDLIISSMNGENFWAKEYGVAYIRLQEHFAEHTKVLHPFEYTGDLGCVSGIFLLAYGLEELKADQGKHALIYASSDNEWRATVCVGRV